MLRFSENNVKIYLLCPEKMSPKESLAGKRVPIEEMLKITEHHPEERFYRAGNWYYPDFYGIYRAEFPGAFPKLRVRLSERVDASLRSHRPEPVEIASKGALKRLQANPALEAFFGKSVFKQKILIVRQKQNGRPKVEDTSRPSMSFRRNENIQILFKAGIDKVGNQLVFLPDFVNWIAHSCAERLEELEMLTAQTFGLEIKRVDFPEPIRIEHLVGYNSYPDWKQLDELGSPKQELLEFPLLRVSLISEPPATD